MRALVRRQWGEEVAERTTVHRLSAGVVLSGHDDQGTACAWAMASGSQPTQPTLAPLAPPPLGAFLQWAQHQGESHLHVFALASSCSAEQAGALARQATAFTIPATVWLADRTADSTADSTVSEVAPVALGAPSEVPASVLSAFVSMIEAAGAEAVVEEGMLRAEVLGLEVGRVVDNPEGGAGVLQVGVGRHDREAHALLGTDGPDSLESVVMSVRAARTPDAPANPANQLAPERWLRTVVVAHPELVGATSLVATPAPILRPNLGCRAPAPAVGTDLHGQPVVVVCSVGVDPDLVPLSADARFAASVVAGTDAGHFRLIVAVPEGDDHPLTHQLADLLRHPASVVTVGADWRHQ